MQLKGHCYLLAKLLVLTLFLCVAAGAQVTTGDIYGRVTDTGGAAVPNATITVHNKATGLSRSTQTNADGEYSLTQLSPGIYDVTAEAKNFNKPLFKDFELNVGAKQTLNFELKPGQISVTVDVTADATAVETTRSDLGKIITPLEVQNLPLINRT